MAKNVRPQDHHPLVLAMAEKDRTLLQAIEEHGDPSDHAIQILRLFAEASAGRGKGSSGSEAKRQADALNPEKVHPEIYLLLLTCWAKQTMYEDRLAEESAVIRRAEALQSGSTHPYLSCAILGYRSHLVSCQGDWEESLRIMKQCCSLAEPGTHLYAKTLCLYAYSLAYVGRLTEVEKELSGLHIEEGSRTAELRAHAWMIQGFETGDMDGALRSAVETSRSPYGEREMFRYRAVAELLRQAGGAPLPEDRAGEEVRTQGWKALEAMTAGYRRPYWAETARLLLRGDVQAALAEKRANLGRMLQDFLEDMQFWGFNAVRVELASRNAASARRLMEIRMARGMRHHLDNFFLARIALLEGSRGTARDRFACLMRSVEMHRARGRLDTELRMACELSPADAADLVWAATEKIPGKPLPARPEAVPPPARAALQSPRIVGISPAMQALRESVQRMARADLPVLLIGETGTGKELVARALHQASPRSTEPFVAINCGTIAEGLLESELFGHARGAFTGASTAHNGLFEEAGRGSVLLDEIGETTPRLQVALLRVLESGEYRPVGSARPRRIRCRVLAATNADLKEMVAAKRFRSDLYFRLCRLVIELPPIRERREDIVPLVAHYLAEGRTDGAVPRVSPEMQSAIESCDWPGNVREIRSFVERLRLMKSESLDYGIEDLALGGPGVGPAASTQPSPASGAEPQTVTDRGEGQGPQAGGIDLGMNRPRSTARRLGALLDLFRRHRKLTRADAVRIIGVSPPTATRDMKALCAEGLIEKVMPKASPRTHYFRLRN
jgi:DNA-binding NtrC family response regulator